ncbi:MAG: hypothetical protein IJN57_00790, partial [Oscillospiraceae bacterium]|nr:hypothetical protein [Oscillospiraceae bacterium]
RSFIVFLLTSHILLSFQRKESKGSSLLFSIVHFSRCSVAHRAFLSPLQLLYYTTFSEVCQVFFSKFFEKLFFFIAHSLAYASLPTGGNLLLSPFLLLSFRSDARSRFAPLKTFSIPLSMCSFCQFFGLFVALSSDSFIIISYFLGFVNTFLRRRIY